MNARTLLTALFGGDDALGWNSAAWGGEPLQATFEPPVGAVELVDKLLSTSLDAYPNVSLMDARQRIDPDAYTNAVSVGGSVVRALDPERVRRLFLEGATMQIRRFERHAGEFASFAEQLEAELGCMVSINAFVAPPNAAALPAHSDPGSTIVLQLAGEKRWEIGRDAPPSRWLRREPILLLPGDVLYLPTRWQHRATAVAPSVSLSIEVKEIAGVPIAWTRRGESVPEDVRKAFECARLRRDRFGLVAAFDALKRRSPCST